MSMEEDIYQTIFMITVFTRCAPSEDRVFRVNLGCCRTVGFRPTFELAEEVVKTNMCDIWEYCYDYACIEEIGCELYPMYQQRWVYKFNRDTGVYEEIDEPQCLKDYCNVSEIG